MSLTAGTRLRAYEILSTIGTGGMGKVYKAKDSRLDRFVAVKVCHDKVSDRFARDARAGAAQGRNFTRRIDSPTPDQITRDDRNGKRFLATLTRINPDIVILEGF